MIKKPATYLDGHNAVVEYSNCELHLSQNVYKFMLVVAVNMTRN